MCCKYFVAKQQESVTSDGVREKKRQRLATESFAVSKVRYRQMSDDDDRSIDG